MAIARFLSQPYPLTALTLSPSLRKRKPLDWIADWCTKTAVGGVGGGRPRSEGRPRNEGGVCCAKECGLLTVRLCLVVGGDEAKALGHIEPLGGACDRT